MFSLRSTCTFFRRSKRISSLSLSRFCSILQIDTNRQNYLHQQKMSYSTVERGCPNSLEYRVYFRNELGPISPFHDIPLFADKENKIYNMVVEVPRWTNAKMEINTKEPLNPIHQDLKKGKLRFVHNCFPHHGYIWNYGAFPQTWEDPGKVDASTGCKGDNDPIDVCEIGYRVASRGQVIQVKVLGTMALIDEGETDWKIIAIDVNDPLADQLNDIEDVEKHMPGFIQATHEWFKIYKMPDGKPQNQFAFDGEAKNKDFAEKVIEETHDNWQELIQSKTGKEELSCSNVNVEDSPCKISIDEAENIIKQSPEPGPAMPRDQSVNKWHFVQL
ncbi:inorganic pyrophosphatase-like [Limulus polyphemus]|uniref:inorganic diphosphatase n=1 Tax=Limulus polyphemus TaxID=6850 RepID=A0ABM1B3E3_LIMPO|nr:inorganic pyrophosphatase-like [Limulus polyphemus]